VDAGPAGAGVAFFGKDLKSSSDSNQTQTNDQEQFLFGISANLGHCHCIYAEAVGFILGQLFCTLLGLARPVIKSELIGLLFNCVYGDAVGESATMT